MSDSAPIPALAAAAAKHRRPLVLLAWLWVGTPFAYGLYELFLKAVILFNG
jgi:hypothetical protein